MIRYSILLLLMLFPLLSHAQVDLRYYRKGVQTAATSQLQFYRSLTKLPIDSITQPSYQQQFKNNRSQTVMFLGYDDYHYWFRLILKNPGASQQLMLLMGPIGMKEGLLYQKQNGHWEIVAHAGLNHRFEERTYQYIHSVFPFQSAPGTDTLLLSIEAPHAYKAFSFALLKPDDLRIFENGVYTKFGIIIGILCLLFLFNLYLFFTLQQKVHLWYSLYIAFLVLIVMKNDNLDQEFLGWDTERMYRLTPIMGVAAIAISILMHVVQQFLVNINKGDRLYKIFQVVKINAITSGVIHIIVFNLGVSPTTETAFFLWANISTTLTILIILAGCVYSSFHGYKSALFIIAGLLVFLIGALQRLTLTSTIKYLYPPSIFHVGMVLETFIISFGLIYRYRIDRQEKLQYLKEKETLKNNFDRLISDSRIEVQEQLSKNISQEIHDNVGQILSVVKLNLSKLNKDLTGNVKDNIDYSLELIGKAIKDLRDLSKRLNTDYIMEAGLVRSMTNDLEHLERRGHYNISIKINGEPFSIEPQKELILYRLFQEIINNTIKHAKANSIDVEITYDPIYFKVAIKDNGVGFNYANTDKYEHGLGLKNMQQRAKLIGAGFDLHSNQKGTTIIITLPHQIINHDSHHL